MRVCVSSGLRLRLLSFAIGLWSNSIVRYLAIQIGDDIIYVNDTNVGGSGINLVEPSDFSFPTSGITIQSPDRCFRLAVNQKPLDGGARAILSFQ